MPNHSPIPTLQPKPLTLPRKISPIKPSATSTNYNNPIFNNYFHKTRSDSTRPPAPRYGEARLGKAPPFPSAHSARPPPRFRRSNGLTKLSGASRRCLKIVYEAGPVPLALSLSLRADPPIFIPGWSRETSGEATFLGFL